MSTRRIVVAAFAVLCVNALALAQDPTEPIPNWTAPPYWTMPAGGQLREHLTGTEASPENQGVSTEAASSTSPILPFTAITPCRLVDTRQSPDTPYLDNGGAGETRTYHFDTTSYYSGTGACGVIPQAAALSLSVQFQVTDHNALLIAYPDDVTRPLVASVVAYNTGLFYMNSAIVPTGADGGINVFAQWGGQVVININGYYAPSNIVTKLNTKTGDVTLAAGSNVDISPSGNTLTISMTGAPGGTLPTGTAGQTLYSNGSGWVASSLLTNDGSANVVVMGNFGASGKLKLPGTTSSTSGVITFGGNPFIHNYAAPGSIGTNTFVGQYAGNFYMGGTTAIEGSQNTAVGAGSLESNGTGSANTAIGENSLAWNTTGYYNTASGENTLMQNTQGSRNTAIGAMSMYANQTAWDNTAVGYVSLAANTTGRANTAIGMTSLNSNTEGADNAALGSSSLRSNLSGSYNTAVGDSSLYANTTGSNNIALGNSAGGNLTTGHANIDIGNQGVAAEANTIRIGTAGNQNRTFIAGIRGVTTGTNNAIAVLIDSNGQLGTASSSIRFKQDVADMGNATSGLLDLRPVTFRYKAQPNGPRHFGLIAEEVEQVMPELVVRDATGQPETVAYHELPAMLLNELQKQQATIHAQQARVQGLGAQLAAERARNDALEARLAALEARLAAK